MNGLRHLQGMRDLAGGAWLKLKRAQDKLAGFFSLYGYAPLETPLLEPTELFLRKSGGEMAVRTYAFADPGGNQVSLRPEFTASVVRHYMETWREKPLPWRVQYAGPVFRYQPGEEPRQFTQVGAELVGCAGPEADAEVLCLCIQSLKEAGVREPLLALGDAGVYTSVLESLGLSERARLFILGSLSQLREGPAGVEAVKERARQFHLPAGGPREELRDAIRHLDRKEAQELLHQLLVRSESSALGQRTIQKVEERLLFKLQGGDDPASMEKGLEVASRLAAVRGATRSAIASARKTLKSYGLGTSALARLEEALRLAALQGLPRNAVTLDFGLARGIAYYTGIVFEVNDSKNGLSLGGGGRYDTLVRALGHPEDVPALGFAFTLENVAQAVGEAGPTVESETHPVLVVPAGREAYGAALQVAAEMRREGTPAEVEVCGRSIAEARAYARTRGIRTVVEVDASGKAVKRSFGGRR
ncbi:MAG: HisS family protein [Chloroflexota bacterium]|nr:HisS family protein [Chloroflexota bacterium]